MDFLFHKVSEKEKQEIKEQAKSIMDSFSKKLSKIDKKIEEPVIERVEGEREESAPSPGDDLREQRSRVYTKEVRVPQGGARTFSRPLRGPGKSSKKIFTKGKEKEEIGCDEEFRKIMFENAPEKNKDFIIAEKKRW